MTGRDDLGLYFHIPFCAKKCPYCHFFVMSGVDKHRNAYMQALKMEWGMRLPQIEGRPIDSIYLGGGTPTQLPAQDLAEIISWIPKSPTCEVTIEANPDDVTHELISYLARAGVNRLSLGVQSLAPDSLIQIGRTHTANRAVEAVRAANEAGIENITIDLMYDLPGQTLASFQQTLDQLDSLPITHLSLYNLVIEPNSAFYRKKGRIEGAMPQGEESLALLEAALSKVEEIGLKRYEISAFAKPGCESRHNSRYWKGGEFYGLGPSAFSYIEGSRFQNAANFKTYCQSLEESAFPIAFSEALPPMDHMRELFAVRLRLLEGAHLDSYPGLREVISSEIEELVNQELITESQGDVKLTPKGTLFYDSVASAIIA